MDRKSEKKLMTYLENFRKNYHFFTLTYKGKNLSLYLDQFIHDQTKMAQVVYGDHGAKMVKELAKKIRTNRDYLYN